MGYSKAFFLKEQVDRSLFLIVWVFFINIESGSSIFSPNCNINAETLLYPALFVNRAVELTKSVYSWLCSLAPTKYVSVLYFIKCCCFLAA